MTPGQWSRVERLYHEATSVPVDQRAEWLAGACDGDEVVRREVESLLAQHASTPDAFDTGALAHALGRSRENLTGRRLGGYAFIELIDEGGMGQVYRARDAALPRDVAVKVITPEFAGDPARRARFRREAGIMAALTHPHIAHVYAFVEAEGRSLLAMELVSGETLAATLRRGALRREDALRYAAEIADALAEAHAAGIVHRDLKPGNVMVTSRGVKVLDFGLARYETAAGSQTATAVAGTPAYMAPEQALGQPADARADLFSLGLLLYEMATGRLPVPGASLGSMLASDPAAAGIVSRARIRGTAPVTMRGIESLIATLLERDPARRTLSAAEVAARLRAMGTSRRPSAGSLGAVAAVALLAVAGGWWAMRTPAADALPLQVAGLSPVSAAPGSKREPALSPDGRAIAFVSRRESGVAPGIFVIPQPGAAPVQLTVSPTEDVSPAWSPDGTRIAFLRIRPGRANELMVVGAAPGSSPPATIIREVRQPEQLTRSTGPLLTWTPDGAILLPLDDPESGLTSLFRVGLNGGAPRRVVRGTGGQGTSSPAFSRDGQWLVYSDADASGRQLYLQRMEGDTPRGERQQVPDSLSGRTPSLSPDGSRLIWAAESRLMQWDRTGSAGAVYVLPNDSFNALTASWPDGHPPRAVFANEGTRVELHQIALKDGGRGAHGAPAPFVNLSAGQANPALSPDGRWLAFAAVGTTGGYEIWMAGADGSNPRPVIPVNPGAALTWSSDSRHLAFHARPPQLAQAFTVDVDEDGAVSQPRQVTNSGFELFGPVYSADGKHLYITSTRVPSAMRIVRIPVAGGELEDLFEGQSARISADGRRILYARSDRRGIWERSLDGDIRANPEIRIVEDYLPPAGFVPGRTGIFYTGRNAAGQAAAIRFFDYAQQRSFDLAPAARMQAGSVPVLTLSPDERRLVYFTSIRSDSNLTSIEFKR